MTVRPMTPAESVAFDTAFAHAERVKGLESVIRDGIATLEQSILHHTIERDGWSPEDECYQDAVRDVVAAIIQAAAIARTGIPDTRGMTDVTSSVVGDEWRVGR